MQVCTWKLDVLPSASGHYQVLCAVSCVGKGEPQFQLGRYALFPCSKPRRSGVALKYWRSTAPCPWLSSFESLYRSTCPPTYVASYLPSYPTSRWIYRFSSFYLPTYLAFYLSADMPIYLSLPIYHPSMYLQGVGHGWEALNKVFRSRSRQCSLLRWACVGPGFGSSEPEAVNHTLTLKNLPPYYDFLI